VNLLIGAATTGLILALLGLGVFISYRVYHTLDLTADGSFGVGAAVAAALLVRHVHPLTATATALVAGALAGGITGILHTRFKVSALLAGVLTSTALYSVSLFVMGSGNVSLASTESLTTLAERLGQRVLGLPESLTLLGATVSGASLAALAVMTLMAGGLAVLLALFLGTDLGLAMRAAGNNPQMAKALAIDVDLMIVLGLGLSNALIALSGALFAQFDLGFASIQIGIGALVTGLANLMLGEALLGRRSIGRWIAGAVVGAVVFRLLVAAAVRAGLNPNALKLVTALFVLVVLVLPRLMQRGRRLPSVESAPSHA
jgi:putative tryptophan/tyrosine transport system permease protein